MVEGLQKDFLDIKRESKKKQECPAFEKKLQRELGMIKIEKLPVDIQEKLIAIKESEDIKKDTPENWELLMDLVETRKAVYEMEGAWLDKEIAELNGKIKKVTKRYDDEAIEIKSKMMDDILVKLRTRLAKLTAQDSTIKS